MILVKLLRFLAGYVKISVAGKYPERFLNLCANRGIRVWYSHRRGDRIDCCVYARDYKKLRSLRRQAGVRLRIRRKCGLPIFCFRYRRRVGLLVGAALFCGFLALMPRFVWSIEIRGDEGIEEQTVRSALSELGLTVGTPLNRVDAGDLRLRLALRVDNVSWAAINDDGTAVTVEVRSARPREDAPDGYANLVAQREGQVVAMTVRSGAAAVRVGDAVVAGQLLVSGTESYADGRTVFRYSDGEVIAETRRTLSVTVPLRQTVTEDAGKPIRRRTLSVFGITVPLYIGQVDGNVRRTVERTDLVIGGVTLPAAVTTATFTPVREKSVTLSEPKAKARAEHALRDKMASELADVEILEAPISVCIEGDAAVASATCICRENIARAEPLAVEAN